MKFELPKSLLALAAVAGAGVASLFGSKPSNEDVLKITRVISIEIVTKVGIERRDIEIAEEIPHSDHLKQSTDIARAIHFCLKNKSLPNGREFFIALEGYLRSSQIDVMRNPDSIYEIKKEFTNAVKWYREKASLQPNDFKMALHSNGPKATASIIENTRH